MKKLILTTLFSTILIISYSQEKKEEKAKDLSKMSTFSAKTGTLIESSHADIGKLGSIQIQTSVLTNLITGEKTKGIRFEKPTSKEYGSDAINFLDEDEIDGLLKSIAIIKSKVGTEIPTNYKEVNFRARSNFEFGCYWSKEWKYFIKVDMYNSDSIYFMGTPSLNKFEEYLTTAQESLKSL